MRKPIFFLGFVVLSLALPPGSVAASAQGQDDPVLARIIQIGKTDNQTMTWLDVLTNRFGTRLAGSDNSNNAAAWAVAQFRSWGLQAELQEAGELRSDSPMAPPTGRSPGPPTSISSSPRPRTRLAPRAECAAPSSWRPWIPSRSRQ